MTRLQLLSHTFPLLLLLLYMLTVHGKTGHTCVAPLWHIQARAPAGTIAMSRLGLVVLLLLVNGQELGALARTEPQLGASTLSHLNQLSPQEKNALASVLGEARLTQFAQGLLGQELRDVPPRSGIPEGVECITTTWCDDKDICADVCERGSVKQTKWQQWAMKYQGALARTQPLCYTQLLASHNSAITLSDGYGNRDDVYSAYLQWLKTLGAATRLHTNSQWFSLTDQLNMGVRVLELDVHFVAGELRISHCGGLHSDIFDHLVSLVNAVAKLLGRPELVWDAATVGCSPSLSSIAVKDERLFADALAEIAAWMKEPRNAHEFLILFLDDQPNLSKWNKVPQLLEEFTSNFPTEWILTPPEARKLATDASAGGADIPVPSINDLVAQGKRLIILSATDYKEESDALLFSNDTIVALCPYEEAWMQDFVSELHADQAGDGSPAQVTRALLEPVATSSVQQRHGLDSNMCLIQRPREGRLPPKHELLFSGTLLRMPSCELQYGPWDCHFRSGEPNRGLMLNESSLAEVTACGLNFPAPDLLTPSRAAAHLWAWAPDHPPVDVIPGQQQQHRLRAQTDNACTYADVGDGRWRTGPCLAPGSLEASAVMVSCRFHGSGASHALRNIGARLQRLRHLQHTDLWQLVPLASCTTPAGCCPEQSTHDVPHTAVENLLLRQALQAHKASRALLPLKPPNYYPSWLPQ